MQDELKICLDGNQNNYCHKPSNYKKWLFGIFITILILYLTKLWITRDITSNFHPSNTITTIRIIKTSHTAEILYNNIGSRQVISGKSIDFSRVIQLTNREFSLHLNNNGVVDAVTIDSQLKTKDIISLKNSGYFIFTTANSTLISTTQKYMNNHSVYLHPLKILNPWYNGDYIQDNGRTQKMITITKDSLDINVGYKSDIKYSTNLSKNTHILAIYNINESNNIPLLSTPLLSNTVLNNFIDKLRTPNLQLILGTDDQGFSFYITIPSTDTNTQNIATIAQELLKLHNLSTLVLTMDDGNTINEIISDSDILSSSINTESGINTLYIKDQFENYIYMVQTPNFWTISNRKSELTLDNNLANSEYNKNISIYLEPQQLLTNITNNQTITDNITNIPMLLTFGVITINGSKTKLYW